MKQIPGDAAAAWRSSSVGIICCLDEARSKALSSPSSSKSVSAMLSCTCMAFVFSISYILAYAASASSITLLDSSPVSQSLTTAVSSSMTSISSIHRTPLTKGVACRFFRAVRVGSGERPPRSPDSKCTIGSVSVLASPSISSSSSSSSSAKPYRLKCSTRIFQIPVSGSYEMNLAPIFPVCFSTNLANFFLASSSASAPPLGNMLYQVNVAGRFNLDPTGGLLFSSSSIRYIDTAFSSITQIWSRSAPRTSTAPSHSIFPKPTRSTEKPTIAARSSPDKVARTWTFGVHLYPVFVSLGARSSFGPLPAASSPGDAMTC